MGSRLSVVHARRRTRDAAEAGDASGSDWRRRRWLRRTEKLARSRRWSWKKWSVSREETASLSSASVAVSVKNIAVAPAMTSG